VRCKGIPGECTGGAVGAAGAATAPKGVRPAKAEGFAWAF
jgi:hypothetical protein